MKQFSHSKLQVYERCPLQYKFQYLTKLKAEHEHTVEAFKGSCVHGALELLYRDLLKTKLNTLEDLIKFYNGTWQKEWSDEIVINNKEFTRQNYLDSGIECLKHYYEEYYPFDQDQTLGVEKKISLKWGEIEIIGYVDRLSREGKGVYAVHDYKTGSMMDQSHADKDRQLALYSIAVKQTFKEAREVKLIWHYVAYGEDVVSRRTDEELEQLKQDILTTISEINRAEKDDDFPAQENKCEWCGYWQYCPKKKHLYKIKELPENEYLKDDGVKLAKKYIELADKRSTINRQARSEAASIEEELMKVEEAILRYGDKNGTDVLDGGERLVVIDKTLGYSIPTKSGDGDRYCQLEALLKDTPYWPKVSSINSVKLSQFLEEDALDKKIKDKIINLAPLTKETKISIRKK